MALCSQISLGFLHRRTEVEMLHEWVIDSNRTPTIRGRNFESWISVLAGWVAPYFFALPGAS